MIYQTKLSPVNTCTSGYPPVVFYVLKTGAKFGWENHFT